MTVIFRGGSMESPNRTNAITMAAIWDQLLQNSNINICTDAMSNASILDANIMRILRLEKQASIKKIGTTLNVPTSTLSSAIKRLEKQGLIKRTICKEDLRSYEVSFTKKGNAIFAEFYEKEIQIMELLLGKLDGQEEQNEFIRLFSKIIKGESEE